MEKAKFSKSTGGIYPIGLYTSFPDDALDIPDSLYSQYLNKQIYRLDVVAGIVVDAESITGEPQFKTKFMSLEFLERFTETEQISVVEATMVSAEVKLWYDKMLAASYVDLNDPRTEGGIDALIAAGLIEADRKQALLTPEEIQP